jgi:uncharacterized membrane protein YvbJ
MDGDSVTCSSCGAELADEPRRPCPKCGSTARTFGKVLQEKAAAVDSVSTTVDRGVESWGWFYLVLGFALQIEATLIAMLPLLWWANMLIVVVVFAVTFWLFLRSRWFQNFTVGLKIRIEVPR